MTAAAATALNFAQPSVSHHLARLQAETGVQLIARVGRGIRLTQDGETLARRAAEIVGRVESAEAELAALAGLRTGRVRVAAFQSALSVWVPPAAAALRSRHPDLELRLTDAHPTVALRWLRDGKVDVAILFRYDDTVPNDDVRYDHVADDPMYLLSLRHGDTLTDHRDAAWIAGCEHCRRDFIAACEAAGFTPNIAYTTTQRRRAAPTSAGRCARLPPARRRRRRSRAVRQWSTDEPVELTVGGGALLGGERTLLSFPLHDCSHAVLDTQARPRGIVEPRRVVPVG